MVGELYDLGEFHWKPGVEETSSWDLISERRKNRRERRNVFFGQYDESGRRIRGERRADENRVTDSVPHFRRDGTDGFAAVLVSVSQATGYIDCANGGNLRADKI